MEEVIGLFLKDEYGDVLEASSKLPIHHGHRHLLEEANAHPDGKGYG